MGKYEIQINTEKCTGCLRCQLACSDLYAKAFNPSKARLRVVTSGPDSLIQLEAECNQCGVCVDHCFFEALEKTKRETEK